MKLPALLVLLIVLLAGCQSHPLASAWPKPVLTYTHAATAQQAASRIAAWRAETPGNYSSRAALTGSMRPYIHGGPREFLLIEPMSSAIVLQPGHVVGFLRDADTPRCLHMVAAVRGEHVYLSGTNNRWSDGWYHRSAIHSILREVVTLPAEGVRL